jgi:hypothetical protein
MTTPTTQESQVREQLSTLVDGELSGDETSFLMRRLAHDRGLRECFGNYHLIGDCLRRQAVPGAVADGFAERVSRAVADQARPTRALPWRAGAQWAAGVFTAAIVAAGAFWYVQPPGTDGTVQVATGTAEVESSGIRADDLRRQLPLLPVSARSSRPLGGEFAPQPDPEAWQRASVSPLTYPSTQYIILLPRAPQPAPDDAGSR